MKPAATTVSQTVEFDVPPRLLFELYADARRHAKVIGATVRFERRVGGRFSAWGGGVSGVNIVLRAPSLIVQAWRAEDFPEESYSILHLSFNAVARGGTRLELVQHGVPRKCARTIARNWHECYWESMQRMLSVHRKPS